MASGVSSQVLDSTPTLHWHSQNCELPFFQVGELIFNISLPFGQETPAKGWFDMICWSWLVLPAVTGRTWGLFLDHTLGYKALGPALYFTKEKIYIIRCKSIYLIFY